MSKHVKVPNRTPKSVSKNTASASAGLLISSSSYKLYFRYLKEESGIRDQFSFFIKMLAAKNKTLQSLLHCDQRRRLCCNGNGLLLDNFCPYPCYRALFLANLRRHRFYEAMLCTIEGLLSGKITKLEQENVRI